MIHPAALFPTEILWRTPEEVEEWSQARNHFIARALREGGSSMKGNADDIYPDREEALAAQQIAQDLRAAVHRVLPPQAVS